MSLRLGAELVHWQPGAKGVHSDALGLRLAFGRALRLAIVVSLIAGSGHGSQDPGTTGGRSQSWQAHVESGILAETYLDRIDCVGGPWNELRARFAEHVHQGRWLLGVGFSEDYEKLWVGEQHTWELIKAAEEIVELWRRTDLGVKATTSIKESLMTMSRSITEDALATVDVAMAATIMKSHLEQISEASAPMPRGLAASCYPGFLVAMIIFGRALAVLGANKPVASDDEDGFRLWRQEHGYLLEELFIGEGASIVDLFQAPGWPEVDACFVEQVLHVPGSEDVKKVDVKEPLPGPGADAIVKLGRPRQQVWPKPTRLPTPQRYHRATDPMGASGWGTLAAKWMARREEVVQASLAVRQLPPWWKVGPAWVTSHLLHLDTLGNRAERIRLLAFISQHGALDLEMPELLLTLFPNQIEGKFLFTGVNQAAICNKGEGSLTIHRLCNEFSEKHGGQFPDRVAMLNSPPPGGRKKLLDGRVVPDVNDPRLYFSKQEEGAMPGSSQHQRLLPDILMLSSFIEAIWAHRHFPEMPLLLYFGPPLLLDVGVDMQSVDKNGGGSSGPVATEFWQGIEALLRCTMHGRCMISAESLFRSEQFFYQTGVEVPFLRPMSVWVNATYNPQPRKRDGTDQVPRHEVLLHNRGRLKYEVQFTSMLQNLAGPAFPFRIASQDGQIIPFSDLATYHAVVIVPWSPEICMLRHLFKMRVPLFVPDRSLLRNLIHISNRRLMPYPYHLSMPGSNRAWIESLHPYDPFWDTIRRPADPRGIEARIYWAEYSEYLLLPMLQYFTSGASLLVGLVTLDGQKASARMRKAYLEDMEEMRSFWNTALSKFVSPESERIPQNRSGF